MDQAAQPFSHGEGEEETGEKRDGGKYLEKENVGGPSTFLSLFFFLVPYASPFTGSLSEMFIIKLVSLPKN